MVDFVARLKNILLHCESDSVYDFIDGLKKSLFDDSNKEMLLGCTGYFTLEGREAHLLAEKEQSKRGRVRSTEEAGIFTTDSSGNLGREKRRFSIPELDNLGINSPALPEVTTNKKDDEKSQDSDKDQSPRSSTSLVDASKVGLSTSNSLGN